MRKQGLRLKSSDVSPNICFRFTTKGGESKGRRRQAARKKNSGTKRKVESYQHTDKTRLNNQSVGHVTPAMEAGVLDCLMSLEDVVAIVDEWESRQKTAYERGERCEPLFEFPLTTKTTALFATNSTGFSSTLVLFAPKTLRLMNEMAYRRADLAKSCKRFGTQCTAMAAPDVLTTSGCTPTDEFQTDPLPTVRVGRAVGDCGVTLLSLETQAPRVSQLKEWKSEKVKK
jgi:hypothetical protein